MNPDTSRSGDTSEFDPATLVTVPSGVHLSSGADEWALIRYVGAPIGEVILLQGRGVDLGRSTENHVCLPEAEVSRHHARLDLVAQAGRGQIVQVTDLGSTNGTYVNGRRIGPDNGAVRLQHGDVLRVGGHAFKLKRLDALERHYHEAVLAQTTVDALTGVSNRATVLGFLEKQTDLAKRHHRELSVILCDLDEFKAVNDQHGHATGDLVLQLFGVLLLGRLRGSDHVGRIGGEEFLIILPETPGSEALNVAEDLRAALAAEPVNPPDGGPPFHVTCSLGVVQCQDTDANGGSLLARADVALYRAKGLGRNRAVFDGNP